MVNIWAILAMEMKLDMARQNCKASFWFKPWQEGCCWGGYDNNKTLLTKVSACFIIIEVYSMRKISVNL